MLKRSILAAGALAAALAMASPGLASDLNKPIYSPAPARVNWTGFYVGVFGGYGWQNSQGNSITSAPQGALAGAGVGYDWRIGNMVVGLVGDGAWSDIHSSSTIFGTSADRQLNWLATARARAGFLPFDSLLIYGTGGVAAGQAKASVGSASDSDSGFGWVVGAGAEWQFVRGWSAGLEYLYTDLGSITLSAAPAAINPKSDLGFNIVKVSIIKRF